MSVCHVCGVSANKFSRKCLKLTDEVYFKDTTFVGNSVHKIFEDFRKGRYTLLDCFLEHPELYKIYYLMLKSIKNLDKCDLSIFVPRK